MLNLNERLGFVRQPDHLFFRKDLRSNPSTPS
jgi:hypothetical protein